MKINYLAPGVAVLTNTPTRGRHGYVARRTGASWAMLDSSGGLSVWVTSSTKPRGAFRTALNGVFAPAAYSSGGGPVRDTTICPRRS